MKLEIIMKAHRREELRKLNLRIIYQKVDRKPAAGEER